MNIKDIFHGAVLWRVTQLDKRNLGTAGRGKRKISLIEIDAERSPVFSIDTDAASRQLLVKYDSTPRGVKSRILYWDFSLKYRKNCFVALVCVESKRISGSTLMEICVLSPEEVDKIFDTDKDSAGSSVSFVVSLQEGKSFRVNRKQKDIELLINRKAIDDL